MYFFTYLFFVSTVASFDEYDPTSTFYYFAYGSNMFAKRIHLEIPDATYISSAVLWEHRLDFTTEVSWWNGAIATICKDPEESVWGVLWLIPMADKKKLDSQEGVYLGWYHEREVIVYPVSRERIPAVTYIQNYVPRKLSRKEFRPVDRQPSTTYLRVMILGAIQGGLPVEYVKMLYNIPHNGRQVSEEMMEKLGISYKEMKQKVPNNVYI